MAWPCLKGALLVLFLGATCVFAEDLIEHWVRAEFVQVPGGVCPAGSWPVSSDSCGGSVLYGCLPTWSGIIDFVDGTPVNCTLDTIVVTVSGSFGCPTEAYTVTAVLNGQTVVGETLVDPHDHVCGCTEGTDSLVVAEFDPSEVEDFQFGVQNIIQLTAGEGFCACLTKVVGTFRCDLEQDEHEKFREQQVLEQLYHLTNGDNWFNNAGWLEGTPCTNLWYGISCDAYGHVVSISLSSNNLNGVLPDLSPAGSLVAIEVMDNRLFGSLPELPRSVTEMFFSVNNFQGSIPNSWASLEQVEFFNIDDNFLSGTISQDLLYGLVDVVQFSVTNNFFNGTFPNDLSRNLRLLELSLSFNQFSGSLPRDFPSVDDSHLQYMYLDHNTFSGPLPVDFATKLPLLSMITVEQNDFTGTLPANFASLPRLLRLNVRDNRLSGVLPDAYNDRPDLYILAGGNDWTCPLPDWCNRGVSTCGVCDWLSGSSSSSSSSSSPVVSSEVATPTESVSEDDTDSVVSLSTVDGESTLEADRSTDVGLLDGTTSVTTTTGLLNTDDAIVVVVATIIFSLCGISIIVGVLLFLLKKRRTGELELPSFVDNDE